MANFVTYINIGHRNRPETMNKNKKVKFKTIPRYRLTFVNENMLNQIWSIKFSRPKVIIVSAIIVFSIISLGIMLISFTPLRGFLPGYLRNTERREFIAATERIDSLRNVVAINDMYITNLHDIISGNVNIDSLRNVPTNFVGLDTAALLSPSAEERAFVEQYSRHEGFSIDSTSVVLPEAPAFVAPVRNAVVVQGRTPASVSFSIDSQHTDVFAIARGCVIDVYETAADEGKKRSVVIIQHPDGYLSRYENLSNVHVRRGRSITSGQKIGNYAVLDKFPFGFTLHRDGIPLNPINYIPF